MSDISARMGRAIIKLLDGVPLSQVVKEEKVVPNEKWWAARRTKTEFELREIADRLLNE